jgi:hypothetical protein
MAYLHDRLDELADEAQDALESIPTEISADEVELDWADSYETYERCNAYIKAIQAELEYGDKLV